MKKVSVIGLDLAKNVFHVIGCDRHGKELLKRAVKRNQLLSFFAQLPPTLVGIESCASAHYWNRELEKLGHQVKQLPPRSVKAFVQGNKNDYNDARAITEAAVRRGIRVVQGKTVEQQDVQALIRLRAKVISERTALSNQLRGLLSEYGIVFATGLATLRRQLPNILEDGDNGLSVLLRELLSAGYVQLQELDAHIEAYDKLVQRYSHGNEQIERLQSIPGFGPLVASVFYSEVGSGEGFQRGRDVSAALGLVPRQHSSGGKERLLGISKRGNGYLRSLLVQGARAVLMRAEGKTDRLSQWVIRLKESKGSNKAIVALANKMARIGWAILAQRSIYQAAQV